MSRVAVVTGAASGIGLGHRPAARRRRPRRRPARPQRRGRRGGAPPSCAAGGITAPSASRSTWPTATRSTPPSAERPRRRSGAIGIVVTSAGIESFTPLADITHESWDRIIAVNLTGTFACVQAAVPDMVEAGWGRIVTISSSSAQSGAPNMSALRGVEGRRDRAHQGARRRAGAPRHHRQHRSRRASSTPRWPGSRRGGRRLHRRRRGRPDGARSAAPAPPTTSRPPARSSAPRSSYVTGQILGVNGGMYI